MSCRLIRAFDLEEFGTVAYLHNYEMLWLGGHWWWFPTASADVGSAVFEWRVNKVYLLEPDGSAVEGILFAGGIATD